jgi:hypothetical protein
MPALDVLMAELTAAEIELARARLAQIRSETREANALWFSYCFKRLLFWGAMLWLLTSIAGAGELGGYGSARAVGGQNGANSCYGGLLSH